MNDEDAGKLLDKHVMELKEHFDAVIILASRDADDMQFTQFVHKARGNFFAQRGMMREMLKRDDAWDIGNEVARQMRGEGER